MYNSENDKFPYFIIMVSNIAKRMLYLPGRMQWMRCYLSACQLPSKELPASCLLIYVCRNAFVMQFVYRVHFPANLRKVREK